MEPKSPQFNSGVRAIPAGSQPKTPSTAFTSMPDYYQVIKEPAKINAAKGGTEQSKYAYGERMTGKGQASELIKPQGRPQPNQGTTSFSPGKGPVTLGGEKPSAIKITDPASKPSRIASFFGGRGGGGLGGMFGIKNR
jgi:hypothetical protein